jgi:hypothetical protein
LKLCPILAEIVLLHILEEFPRGLSVGGKNPRYGPILSKYPKAEPLRRADGDICGSLVFDEVSVESRPLVNRLALHAVVNREAAFAPETRGN